MGPPNLKGSLITNGYRWLNDPYALLDTALAKHGLTFCAQLPVIGKVLITGDPEKIKAITNNRYLVGGRGAQALRKILGNDSLITLEGKAHAARKKLLTAPFRHQSLLRHDHLTIESSLQEIEQLPRKAPFSLLHVVQRITLRSITRVLFGKLDQRKETQLYALINAYKQSFENPLFLFVKFLQIDLGDISPWGRLQRHREKLRRFVFDEIASQRRCADYAQDSVLRRMVEVTSSCQPVISDEAIFNEILGLLLFGHDTSAVTMAWLFNHVYSNERVLGTLRQEVSGITNVSQILDARERSYLHCCILESMRLCPVVVHLTRVATCDLQLGEHHIKAGEKVLPSAYLAQHNSSIFPEPYGFKPTRFEHGQNYGNSYFPFGVSSRKCIGEHLALRQMQLILYCFIKEAVIALEPGYRATPERKMLLIGPAKGTLFRVHR